MDGFGWDSSRAFRIFRKISARRSAGDRMHYKYDEYKAAVARRLRELREARGFGQREFAREHGWDEAHWTRIEAGKKMSLETLVKAANSFDLTVEELISEAVLRHEGPGEGSRGFKGFDDEHKGQEN